MESLQEMLLEIHERPWDEVKPRDFFLSSFVFIVIAYFSNTGDYWVPLLDSTNLAFHEAGHPLFGVFSNRLAVYGGTLGQLVFPAVATFVFWKNRKAPSFFIGVLWIMENFWNIARYMGDARAQILPLTSPDPDAHDWAEILSRWNCLGSDTRLAGGLRFFTGAAALVAWFWLLKKFRSSEKTAKRGTS